MFAWPSRVLTRKLPWRSCRMRAGAGNAIFMPWRGVGWGRWVSRTFMAEAGVRSLIRDGFSRIGVAANVVVWPHSFGWISRMDARDKMSGLP
jgi:hypothetical protein